MRFFLNTVRVETRKIMYWSKFNFSTGHDRCTFYVDPTVNMYYLHVLPISARIITVTRHLKSGDTNLRKMRKRTKTSKLIKYCVFCLVNKCGYFLDDFQRPTIEYMNYFLNYSCAFKKKLCNN